MTEAMISAITVGVLAVLASVFKFVKWYLSRTKANGMKEGVTQTKLDQILVQQTNHTAHHEGWLEPTLERLKADSVIIKENVANIDGKVEVLIDRLDKSY